MWSDQIESDPVPKGETTFPRNQLLRSLPRDELERLAPLLHVVPLSRRRILQHAGVPIDHVYFIEDGLISVLAKTDDCNAVEVWLIGRDGVVGSEALLGIETTALSHFVQIGGSALRITVRDLNCVMSKSSNLRAALHGYVHAALMQSSQSAACSLKHAFEQRLARWLLTAQDQIELDALPITQELLARSLGVHRPTVSATFKVLQGRGIFVKERGLIRIVDRSALERLACRCYRTMALSRNLWQRSETRRKLVVALSVLGALLEVELWVQ
jgi:CRP-like cAMP-binding protein